MPRLRQIVVIGHCVPDAHRLKDTVHGAVPNAKVIIVEGEEQLSEHRTADFLWLVNRILEGEFTMGSGIELIRQVRSSSQPPELPEMILISNFPEAQQAAMAVGARPGFGKSQLYDERTAAILREAAER